MRRVALMSLLSLYVSFWTRKDCECDTQVTYITFHILELMCPEIVRYWKEPASTPTLFQDWIFIARLHLGASWMGIRLLNSRGEVDSNFLWPWQHLWDCGIKGTVDKADVKGKHLHGISWTSYKGKCFCLLELSPTPEHQCRSWSGQWPQSR